MTRSTLDVLERAEPHSVRRPAAYAHLSWDDPFWQVVRLVVDESRGRALDLDTLVERLENGTEAAQGLLDHAADQPGLLPAVVDYLVFRAEAAAELLEHCRDEDEALEDFAQLSKDVVRRYGTQSADHHQSSKVMVATVEVLTRAVCRDSGLGVNVDPQKRAVQIQGQSIWVSPRRLDGALPSLFNSVGLWEIKEYWGGTKGGSKMSDAIYECQLVGEELRTFETLHGIGVRHYAILDGYGQWSARMSDLRRAVDLLCSGLIDELIVGDEVLSEWPRIVQEMCEVYLERDAGIS